LTLLGILTFIFILTSFLHYTSDYLRIYHLNKNLLNIASLVFLGFGLFFASTTMDVMRDKIKRISYLSIPASNFEKYLSRWIVATTGYIVVFFVALWLADLLRILVCSVRFPDMEVRALDFSRLIAPNVWDGSIYAFSHKTLFVGCLSFYFLLQSILLLGSLFWEKTLSSKLFL
ncbi:MAG: hypothetical protein LIO93_07655, partial [Bacteroidales bacterium]|nr:hypothetical protein [Bacteroidales bacterium]